MEQRAWPLLSERRSHALLSINFAELFEEMRDHDGIINSLYYDAILPGFSNTVSSFSAQRCERCIYVIGQPANVSETFLNFETGSLHHRAIQPLVTQLEM